MHLRIVKIAQWFNFNWNDLNLFTMCSCPSEDFICKPNSNAHRSWEVL